MTTIYVRECFAYVIFWVLWCHILYLSLSAILSLFLYVVWGCVLTSLIYMRLSNFSNTTCWRDYLFPSVYCCLLYRRVIDCRCVGLCVFSSIDLYVCFCASTMLFWLLQLCSQIQSLGNLCLQLCSFSSRLLWQFGV